MKGSRIMAVSSFSWRRSSLGIILIITLLMVYSTAGQTNGHRTITEYSSGSLNSGNTIIRIIIAVIGGLISVLGILLAFKNAGALSDVNVSLTNHSLQFKRISQGVVIALLGVIVLIVGLYVLPDKAMVTDESAKSIQVMPGGQEFLAK
jgi:hypothetical protein